MQWALRVPNTKDTALSYEDTPERLAVYWHHLLIVEASPVPTSTTHVKWRCSQCIDRVLRNKALFFQHAEALHQNCIQRASCVGSPSVGYTGHVVTHEVRSRMPWLVASDDPKYK